MRNSLYDSFLKLLLIQHFAARRPGIFCKLECERSQDMDAWDFLDPLSLPDGVWCEMVSMDESFHWFHVMIMCHVMFSFGDHIDYTKPQGDFFSWIPS